MTGVLALGACAAKRAAPGAREVRDELGRTLRLPARVGRVVSLVPSTTEILFAIGAGDALVGVDGYSDYPAAAARVEKVGSDSDPSLERIFALRPDVVFAATSANSQGTVRSLDGAGIPVFVSRTDSLAEIYNDVRAIGAVVGREREAGALAQSMRRRIEAARPPGPPVKTMVLVWSQPLVVAGRASHLHDLIVAAGGENIAADSPQPFPKFSVEALIARAPEVIVVGSHRESEPPRKPLERLTTVPAVRNGRIYSVDGDLLFRPGPRVVEGVETMARLLHGGGPK